MRALWIAALATLALDQASKLAIVFGLDLISVGEIAVAPPWLTFRMAWNRGINFGLFGNDAEAMRWLLVALSLAISVWVIRWVRHEGRWARIAAGLLVGGAVGNAIDRVAYGAVADFLNMSCCGIDNPYAFNVADIAIFAGAFGLILFGGGGGAPRPARR